MKLVFALGVVGFLELFFAGAARALFVPEPANYPLEIIQPQEGGNTQNRHYKAYPGLEYRVPVAVIGGSFPFQYELTAAPAGMIIDADTGIITWASPTGSGSPDGVTVRVTDALGTQDSHSWNLTVTTAGFIFVDASATLPGNGTIGSPFTNLEQVYGGTDYAARGDATYAGQFMYFREGTYDPMGFFDASNCPGQQCKLYWPGTNKPVVWLGYPGERAVIDHDRTADGAFFDMSSVGSATDMFIHRIRFQDMRNHAIRFLGDRVTFFECEFHNLGPGVAGENTSSIMSVSGAGVHDYMAVVNNAFDTMDTGAFIKTYYNTRLLVADNSFSNGTGEGVALKAYTNQADVRANTFQGIPSLVINGNWASCNDTEIRFNLVLGSLRDYQVNPHGALTANYHNTAGVHYIYRNTLDGTVTARFASSGTGPFHFTRNVIVNNNEGVPAGSHITHYSVAVPSLIQLTDNLAGYPADGLIDAAGRLTGSYSTYEGTHGHVISGEVDLIFTDGFESGNTGAWD